VVICVISPFADRNEWLVPSPTDARYVVGLRGDPSMGEDSDWFPSMVKL